MQQQIFELLLEQEDVSWKSILQELVKKEEMDPWDVDISMLSQKYIQIIKEMQEHDFRISGKILLAAAFLLKMKSAYLVDHDIAHLDQLIGQNDGSDESEIFEELENGERRVKDKYSLIPRNPQPRTRKVSLQELVYGLSDVENIMEIQAGFSRELRVLDATIATMVNPDPDQRPTLAEVEQHLKTSWQELEDQAALAAVKQLIAS